MEESQSRTNGIRGVGDDDTVVPGFIREEFKAETDEGSDSRVVKEGRHVIQGLHRNTDDGPTTKCSRYFVVTVGYRVMCGESVQWWGPCIPET